jgi:hypothetical protein
MLLFFRRDCDDGGGPAVELASPPALAASPAAVPVAGAGGVGWEVAVDVDGCAVVVAGFVPPKLGNIDVAPGVEAAPEVGAGKSDDVGAGAVVVVAPLAGAVVVAPDVAVVPAGVDAAGFILNKELPPVEAPAVGAALKRLGAGAPDAGALLPPREKRVLAGAPDAEPAGGKMLMAGACEEAGEPPRLNDGGLLAGVEEGVLLPSENRGLAASWP